MPVTAKTTENKVGSKSLDYLVMSEGWTLPKALRSGSRGMRNDRDTWLPKEPREDAVAYESRLKRSFLFPAYDDTIEKVSAAPFRKPVKFSEDSLPDERLERLKKSADATGRHLDDFAQDVLDDALDRGLTHILVDVPRLPGQLTLETENELAQPYFVHVKAENLWGWRTRVGINGKLELAQIRIHEVVNVPDGEYGEEQKEFIRVYNAPPVVPEGVEQPPGTWELFEREANTSEYKRVEGQSGTHSFPGIPLVTLYTQRTGYMTGRPPFEGIADLNLAHYQSQSDQRNILRFARVPLVHLSGVTQDEMDKPVVIAAGSVTRSNNPEAKMGYVEHSGAAINAGEKDLEKIEQRMVVLGLQPFIEQVGDVTATGRIIDEGKTQSKAQSWVRALERTLRDAFRVAAQWLSLELPDDWIPDIFNEFALSLRADADIQLLLQACVAGKISDETFLAELVRRGILSPSLNPADEVEKARTDNPFPDEDVEDIEEPEPLGEEEEEEEAA